MKIAHFNVSKESIIESIVVLRNNVQNKKFNINISIGVITNIDYYGRVIIRKSSNIFNISLVTLSKEDLIIILRYLQNMNKCKEIIKTERNKVIAKTKIEKFLQNKKNIAIVDKKTEKF
jgi:hypothetical protein